MKSETEKMSNLTKAAQSKSIELDFEPRSDQFQSLCLDFSHYSLCLCLPTHVYHHDKHSQRVCWNKRTSQCYSTQFKPFESISGKEGKQKDGGQAGVSECKVLWGGATEDGVEKKQG